MTINNITSWFAKIWQRSSVKRYNSPDKLPPEVMAKVMEEANFLRSQHFVDVKTPEEGEETATPKRADE